MLQNRLFPALASTSGFGVAISDNVAYSSIVFCNSVAANRIVVAASRLLGAAAACVILLTSAAEHRKSYRNGCIQAAIAICQQIFALLALVIFPFLTKCFKIVFLVLLAARSGFGAAVSEAVARSSIVLCNSVAAGRIVVAASRFLGAAAACVILLTSAAEHRKSYRNGCIQAAIAICQQIFALLALVIFLFLTKCFKIVFLVLLAARSGFGAAVSEAVARSSIVLCNSVAAGRIVVAASRLLGAAAACVILLSCAAKNCKSYWSGFIQVAIMICQRFFAILALVIFLLKILLKSASKSCFGRFGVEIWF